MCRTRGFDTDAQRERFVAARTSYFCGAPLARTCGALLRNSRVCVQLALSDEKRCLRHCWWPAP